MNFWQELPRPIIGLSPMDGVTDHPFRFITKKYGKTPLLYTEFTSVEGVCHGAEQLLKDFMYDESQRPVIGQIYGSTPEYFRQTAILLCRLGFDGIDLNMGCPAKNVAHSGAGAALIRTPELAQELIRATQQGVRQWQDGATEDDCSDITLGIAERVKHLHAQLPQSYQEVRQIPISVKTRIGYDRPTVQEWIPTLLEMQPAAIALHGRTLKQQYGGLASWEHIAEAAQLVHQTHTVILGNGDVKTLDEAKQKAEVYGVDGILIGRGSMGNPYIFNDGHHPTSLELFNVALEHAQLFEASYRNSPKYNFLPMRKHLGWYVHEVPNASAIRQAIYKTNNSQEFVEVLKKFGYEL